MLIPACDPAGSASAGGVEAQDREVQAFHGCLLVGEVASNADASAEAGVDALDRRGTMLDDADIDRVRKAVAAYFRAAGAFAEASAWQVSERKYLT